MRTTAHRGKSCGKIQHYAGSSAENNITQCGKHKAQKINRKSGTLAESELKKQIFGQHAEQKLNDPSNHEWKHAVTQISHFTLPEEVGELCRTGRRRVTDGRRRLTPRDDDDGSNVRIHTPDHQAWPQKQGIGSDQLPRDHTTRQDFQAETSSVKGRRWHGTTSREDVLAKIVFRWRCESRSIYI